MTQSNHKAYDIVIVGGGIMGASLAWFLSNNSDFTGRVLVVEKDPSYQFASTSHTNSCMRQQFSTALNIRISQFAADFVENFKSYMGDDHRIPDLKIWNFGYMYLASKKEDAKVLRSNCKVQLKNGVHTKLMSPEEIKLAYPFYNLDDIILGSHNKVNEGYWDSWSVFEWCRRCSRERGVEYIDNEVVNIKIDPRKNRVTSVGLKTGEVIPCGYVVNATGPRAMEIANMAGLDLPVEPRKRYSWVFLAEKPLDRDLPLTIDPSGIHFRSDGKGTYLVGGSAKIDLKAEYDDFSLDPTLWLDRVWPILVRRIPQFAAVKVINEWAGHYAYNYFDHNAIIGPHSRVENFIFLNGFSGHGLQQAPAMGRAISEFLIYGEYRSLDMRPLNYGRIERGEKFFENAII